MSKSTSVFDLMRGNIPGIAWPLMAREPVTGLAALLGVIDRTQWMKRRDILARQYSQLVILATHLATHSDQFKQRLEKAGLQPEDLASEEGLRRLPTLRRRDLQVAGDSLYSRAIPQSHMPMGESRTSGSTGEPVAIRRTAVSQLVWPALNIRGQIVQGTDFAKRCSTIRPQITEYAIRKDRGGPI